MIQAEPNATKNLESLSSIKVRNGNEMAPITQFVSVKKVYGPDIISRFNLYTSMKVMVAPASGYTSGQALAAIAEVAKENLPAGFAYELGGMAREEAETSGSTTGLIFVLCFVFVYLLLSAQYEVIFFRSPYCSPYHSDCWVASCLSAASVHWVTFLH